jgi:hypothetical protein
MLCRRRSRPRHATGGPQSVPRHATRSHRDTRSKFKHWRGSEFCPSGICGELRFDRTAAWPSLGANSPGHFRPVQRSGAGLGFQGNASARYLRIPDALITFGRNRWFVWVMVPGRKPGTIFCLQSFARSPHLNRLSARLNDSLEWPQIVRSEHHFRRTGEGQAGKVGTIRSPAPTGN